MIGETGLELALRERGLRFDDEAAEAVVVSFDRGFTYEKLKKACRLIERGARYLATNPDRALKLENGISPGTGAIVAAVTAGCGVEPLMVGKPERLIFDMALQRLGVDPDNAVAVGDNLATDIPAGRKAGIRTALILTGVTTREQAQAARPAPDWIVADYAELEACLAAL
jgi:4-nitrophenyl phosphatase